MEELELLNKIDNNEKLTAKEVEGLTYSCEIDQLEGTEHRWMRDITSICKIGTRYFQIEWQKGLTEYQENEYWNQLPIEVKQIEKQIVIKKWVNINEVDNG